MYSRFWAFPVLVTTLWCATPFTATAQIIPDNTLGSENSVVTPNQNIRGIPSDRIDGGAVRGSNLFHSFQEFNIDNGRGAYFSNPDSIVNILTRVTGDNISNILGTLGVLGNANVSAPLNVNLFFINPNGIVFGPNARLDVGGSFFASTADSILFENGVEFAASNPEAPPLLTINIPLGLNIRENPGTIVNQATLTTLEDGSPLQDNNGVLIPQGLNVPQNQTLALVGGNVLFDNGIAISPGSNIEIGGLSEPGIVELNENGSLTFPSNIQQSNIALTNESQINIRADDGGDININSGNFEMSGGSIIRAGIDAGLGFPEAQVGTININAQNTVSLSEESFISNDIRNDGIGNPGEINLIANSVSMSDDSFLGTPTFGQGNAGNINIVTGSLSMNDSGLVAFTLGEGDAGNITIEAGQLQLVEGAQINVSTDGAGDAGTIIVRASDVELLGRQDAINRSRLDASLRSSGTGSGGSVTIEAERLVLRDGGSILATTANGTGQSGQVSILASESVELSGTVPDSISGSSIFTYTTGTANAGDITIITPSLSIRDDSGISALADESATGNGGNIRILASDSVEIIGLGDKSLLLSTGSTGSGNSGNITIETRRLTIADGGAIIASVDPGSSGNAGNISLNASQEVVISDSVLQAGTGGTGRGGDITINTERLVFHNALVSAASFVLPEQTTPAGGDGGNISIFASDSVEVSDSAIFADTNTTGDAGNVTIQTQTLRVLDESVIFVDSSLRDEQTTPAGGDAGNINIRASDSVEVSDSGISANTRTTGDAGNVTVQTDTLRVWDGSFIFVSSSLPDEQTTPGGGDAGNIDIFASNSVEVSDSQIFAGTETTGNAGNVTLQTETLRVLDGSTIFVRSFLPDQENTPGGGDAGDINIFASNSVEVSDSTIGAETDTTGNAGNVTLQTETLRVLDGSTIFVRSFLPDQENTPGGGDAGDINIFASNSVEVSDSTIGAETDTTGDAGNVTVKTQTLRVLDGSSISVSSDSSGIPGSVDITAISTRVDNQSVLNADSEAGEGGNIRLQSNDVRLLNRSEIRATGSQSSQTFEGNIEIDANLLVLLQGSGIITDASNPTGGSNITIRPLGGSQLAVLQSQNTTIRAAGELEIDDTLNFDPPESLEITVVDPNDLIAQEFCRQRGTSQFTITGRGGLASSPNDIFIGDRTQVPLVEPVRSRPNPSTSIPRSITEPSQPRSSADIIPARGWIRDENGDVILVSYDPTKTGVRRQPVQLPQCQP